MDPRQSFDDGRAGAPRGPDTNINAYREGQAVQQAADFDASQRRSSGEGINWAAFLPRGEVDSVSYTLLLVSPVLFTVYPVLGLGLLAVFGGCVGVARVLPLPMPLEIGIGLVVCIAAFFPCRALEAVASQSALYRWARALWRVLGAFIWTLVFASGVDLRSAGPEVLERASPGAVVGGIVAAIGVHLLFRRLDRVYFPNRKEMRREAELIARGEGITRPLPKRILYGMLWLVPTMIVLNVVIRLVVELTFPGPESIHTFYQRANIFIQLGDLAAWIVLCVLGWLPGTGRYRTKPQPAVAT